MDYFNDVFPTVLGLKCVNYVAGYGGTESCQISSEISCSESLWYACFIFRLYLF